MNELIRKYAAGYEQLKAAVEGLTEEELLFKPKETAWSVKEIVIHVCDTEIVAVHRMKQVISESDPTLTAFDQDLWTQRQHYQQLDMQLHLEVFRVLRESMVPILSGLQADDWKRTGVHTSAGKRSLEEIVGKFIDHVQGHLEQIERVRTAYRNH